jgi:uncharacterized protein YegJ (DUF2314 family)
VFQCAKGYAGNNAPARLSAAILQARGSLAHFRAQVAKGADRAYFIRASFSDGLAHMDLLWIKHVTLSGGGFSGIVDQEPSEVTTVHKGQQVTVSDKDIVDWTIVHLDDSKEGNFTAGLEPVRH